MTRRIALILAVALTLLVGASPVAAKGGGNWPARINLPDGFMPEGITAGRGNTFYVGSLANGAIYRGSLKTGVGAIFIPGAAGMTAVGIDYERRNGRLWVAGGNTHQVRAYNASSGALLATYTFPGAGFLNDLVVTRHAIYVTDSNNSQLRVIPLGNGGALPAQAAVFSRTLTGITSVPDQFNLNGIAWTGRWLIVVQSNTGQLFRVDPATGDARQIDIGTASVTNGDGVEVQGRRIYVVRNRDNLVAVLRADGQFTEATLKGELKSPDNLDVPTTAVVKGGKVWVVNARFPPPVLTQPAKYWITRLSAKP